MFTAGALQDPKTGTRHSMDHDMRRYRAEMCETCKNLTILIPKQGYGWMAQACPRTLSEFCEAFS